MNKFKYIYIGKGIESLPSLRADVVKSSNIDYVAYSPETQNLRVIFQGGAEYSYPNVKPIQFAGMMAAESPTKFFNEHFKANPNHPFEKVVSLKQEAS